MPKLWDNFQYKLYEMSIKARQAPASIPLGLSKTALWTNWNSQKAVKEGYKASTYVYACITKRARAVASVPWYVYEQNSDGTWDKVVNHPLELLIDKPNPFMSRSDFMERLIINLDLTGNSIFQKIQVRNTTIELFPLGPDGIRPIPDDNEFIKAYEYQVGSQKIQIPPDEILHAMYVDPSNVFWGLAPLQVAAKTVDTDSEALNWNKIALQNRAVTDGTFTFDQPLTRDQWQDARQQIREQHQGSQNARAPWVLGGGAKWQSMSLSPVDMDFIEGRKMTREEICTVFEVPPPIVGILDKANYSNMKEARRVFWLDTIIPLLENVKNILNRSINPEYGQGIEIGFDLSNVEALQENFNEKIDGAQKLWSMGVPFNQINQRLELGFEEIEGGDVGFLPASVLPADLAGTFTPPLDNPPPSDTNPPPTEVLPDGEEEGANNLPKSNTPPLETKMLLKYGLNLQTTDQKKMYWKAFERSRSQWYAKVQNEAKNLFVAEGGRVAKAYKNAGNHRAGVRAALREIQEGPWITFLKRNYVAIAEQYGNEFTDGLKAFNSYYKKADNVEDFDPWDYNIQTYLETMAARKVTQIMETTRLQMRSLIALGRDESMTVDDIAAAIQTKFEQYSDYRAFRIARTEVVAASNFGSYFAALQASDNIGITTEKEWVDSSDDRVRESHKDMDGERVPVNEKYSNGMDYPADMLNGRAKEVIHCRCAQVYHIPR